MNTEGNANSSNPDPGCRWTVTKRMDHTYFPSPDAGKEGSSFENYYRGMIPSRQFNGIHILRSS